MSMRRFDGGDFFAVESDALAVRRRHNDVGCTSRRDGDGEGEVGAFVLPGALVGAELGRICS